MTTLEPMKPWERRLADLGTVLKSCHAAYFSPDTFRMNINHFLQTARTVTFIVQKNKASIPGIDAWYQSNVRDAWSGDVVMTWAKDARNAIEKEGDLEAHSFLNLTLVFSYLAEEDVSVQTGKVELLQAGIKVLVRLARKRLPTGVEDAAAVRVERRWVANSLPEQELLHAMRHVYGRLYAVCAFLAEHLGHKLPERIDSPESLALLADGAQQIAYLKLSNLKFHVVQHAVQRFSKDHEPPASIRTVIGRVGPRNLETHTLESTVDYVVSMAEATFNEYGNHIPLLFYFDENWHPMGIVSAHFEDQTDKFIFWRAVAEDIRRLRAHGLSWTSESWVRTMSKNSFEPIRKLPVVGERLHNIVLDRNGNIHNTVWAIERPTTSSEPILRRLEDLSEIEHATPYYLVPAMRALEFPDPLAKPAPSTI